MALIKCPECGKEISDKAPKCIHCGYPLNKKEESKKDNSKKEKQIIKETNNQLDGLTSAWLIIATLICLGIACIQLVAPFIFHLETSTIFIGSTAINTKVDILFISVVLLAIAYLNIILSKNKLSMIFFYIINALIAVLSILRGLNIIPLIYIACVILNTIITTFAVRGRLKDDYKISPISIIIAIIGIILSFVASVLVYKEIEINSRDRSVHVAVFYYDNCKYCNDFFQYVEDVDTFIHLKKLDATDPNTYGLLKSIAKDFGVKEEDIAYPFIVINNTYFIGYSDDNKKDIDKWIHSISDKGSSYDFVEKYSNEHQISPAVPASASPKEKLIAYLKDKEKANCTNSKCTYSFSVHTLNNDHTTIYTVDFDKKTFRTDSNIDGPQYEIYNYGKDNGSAYMESNTGFHVEVNVNVTFTKDEYKYTWKGTIKGLDQTAEMMADQVNDRRNEFFKWCNELNINPKDI